MSAGYKDHFSGVASGYLSFRPRYPPDLVEWLSGISPGHEVAVDLGCGSGQASIALAQHFQEVLALDPSAAQIAQAEPHGRVRYRVAPAEDTGLPAGRADLIVAAQALHWFDQARLHAEIARIAKPSAVFAAICYGLCRVSPGVDAAIDRLYRAILGPFWPPERAHVDSGYRTLPFPWPELSAPSFAISETWSLARLLGYLRTWSAVAAYQVARGEDPIAQVANDLEAAWGGLERNHLVTWALTIRAGRIPPSPTGAP